MKKTTGEAEPKHKESKDSVVLYCQNLSVSIFSTGCKYRYIPGEFLLTSLLLFFLATLWSEVIMPDTI